MSRFAIHATMVVPALLCAAAACCAGGTAWRLEPARASLGRFPSNSPPAAAIMLANDGAEPLGGVRVRTGCGCLTAVAEGDSVPPGGRLRIRLSIAPEKVTGPFSHSVFVEAGGEFRRASVSGEAVPLLVVRPADAANLGDIACGSPFRVEFKLDATRAASLGPVPSTALEVEVNRLSPTSFSIVLRGSAPATPGRFRLSVPIPVASPPGWRPVELAVFGIAKAPP